MVSYVAVHFVTKLLLMATFLNDALTLSQLGISKFQEIIISRKFGQSLELKLNKIFIGTHEFFFSFFDFILIANSSPKEV